MWSLEKWYWRIYLQGSNGESGEGNGTLLQYSCLENPMDGGAWCAAVHGVAKSRTRLSDFTVTYHFHALEKEMATHSSVLAWKILGAGEPGGLPSMGSHRVGHNWQTKQQQQQTLCSAFHIKFPPQSLPLKGSDCDTDILRENTIYSGIFGASLGSDGKESTCNVGDLCSIPKLGRSPGEGNDYPLQ